MERLVYLDTHVLIWLYAGEFSFFSGETKKLLAQAQLIISPVVLLELQYLLEIDRIVVSPEKVFKNLEKNIGLKVCQIEFHKVIQESLKQSWTRDPFDRLIVAQAAVAHAALISKDASILKYYPRALWK